MKLMKLIAISRIRTAQPTQRHDERLKNRGKAFFVNSIVGEAQTKKGWPAVGAQRTRKGLSFDRASPA